MRHILLFLFSFVLTYSLFPGTPGKKARRKGPAPPYFLGEWESTHTGIPYSAHLTLLIDNSFTFWAGACAWHGSSSGRWRFDNGHLFLNSDKNDRYCETRFGQPGSEDTTLKRSCGNLYGDFVVFKNEEFYLKNDSLFHVSQIPGAGYYERHIFTRLDMTKHRDL